MSLSKMTLMFSCSFSMTLKSFEASLISRLTTVSEDGQLAIPYFSLIWFISAIIACSSASGLLWKVLVKRSKSFKSSIWVHGLLKLSSPLQEFCYLLLLLLCNLLFGQLLVKRKSLTLVDLDLRNSKIFSGRDLWNRLDSNYIALFAQVALIVDKVIFSLDHFLVNPRVVSLCLNSDFHSLVHFSLGYDQPHEVLSGHFENGGPISVSGSENYTCGALSRKKKNEKFGVCTLCPYQYATTDDTRYKAE
ncbi:hypothetical protein CLUG_00257 [Clavispora lusitaniae ATCC 42720]|uniref:Uncharacterized protein n=1 Tax=Clavispora lusitaniae (strain ATCC 42720) TaxID=306902 RepID=C4XWD4_CLAL4|nr:uncharacterized protein CLUG_00257 [Clavispora lusitaniae ATCC 42720]EEQ36134.1 hypothetical protein CLUG_00257 [Clavispora lusitaniae ATCC 42720]